MPPVYAALFARLIRLRQPQAAEADVPAEPFRSPTPEWGWSDVRYHLQRALVLPTEGPKKWRQGRDAFRQWWEERHEQLLDARDAGRAQADWEQKAPVFAVLEALLSAWQQDGYFTRPIALFANPPDTQGTIYVHPSGAPHRLGIGLSRDGSIKLWSARELRGFATKAPRSVPAFLTCLVLGHEVGHTLIEHDPVPLAAAPAVPSEVVAALNAHCFHPASDSPHRLWFKEAFADAYAAMLLLRTTAFHPQAIAEVHFSAEARAANDVLYREAYASFIAQEEAWSGVAVHPYDTAAVVMRVIQTRQAWEALPAAALKAYAKALVSACWWERAWQAERSPVNPVSQPCSAEHFWDNDYNGQMALALLQGTARATFAAMPLPAGPLRQYWEAVLDQSEQEEALKAHCARLRERLPQPAADPRDNAADVLAIVRLRCELEKHLIEQWGTAREPSWPTLQASTAAAQELVDQFDHLHRQHRSAWPPPPPAPLVRRRWRR